MYCLTSTCFYSMPPTSATVSPVQASWLLALAMFCLTSPGFYATNFSCCVTVQACVCIIIPAFLPKYFRLLPYFVLHMKEYLRFYPNPDMHTSPYHTIFMLVGSPQLNKQNVACPVWPLPAYPSMHVNYLLYVHFSFCNSLESRSFAESV